MGNFSSIKKAKAARGPLRRFEIGKYRCRIDSMKFDKSRTKVEFFAVAMTIEMIISGGDKMNVGDSVDWSCMSNWDNYDSLVKEFIIKAYNEDEAALDALSDAEFDELMELATGKEQSAAGRYIDVECIPWTNKKGEETTVTRFSPVADDEQPSAVQQAAAG